MAREVTVSTWCDRCLLKSDKQVQGQAFPCTLDGTERTLDLCEDCYAELVAPLLAVLEEVGAKAASTEQPRRKRLREDSGYWPCLFCGKKLTSRSGVQVHALKYHGVVGYSWSALYGTAACPECGKTGVRSQDAHARGEHGWPSLAAQWRGLYERGEDPHGLVAAAFAARGLAP